MLENKLHDYTDDSPFIFVLPFPIDRVVVEEPLKCNQNIASEWCDLL